MPKKKLSTSLLITQLHQEITLLSDSSAEDSIKQAISTLVRLCVHLNESNNVLPEGFLQKLQAMTPAYADLIAGVAFEMMCTLDAPLYVPLLSSLAQLDDEARLTILSHFFDLFLTDDDYSQLVLPCSLFDGLSNHQLRTLFTNRPQEVCLVLARATKAHVQNELIQSIVMCGLMWGDYFQDEVFIASLLTYIEPRNSACILVHLSEGQYLRVYNECTSEVKNHMLHTVATVEKIVALFAHDGVDEAILMQNHYVLIMPKMHLLDLIIVKPERAFVFLKWAKVRYESEPNSDEARIIWGNCYSIVNWFHSEPEWLLSCLSSIEQCQTLIYFYHDAPLLLVPHIISHFDAMIAKPKTPAVLWALLHDLYNTPGTAEVGVRENVEGHFLAIIELLTFFEQSIESLLETAALEHFAPPHPILYRYALTACQRIPSLAFFQIVLHSMLAHGVTRDNAYLNEAIIEALCVLTPEEVALLAINPDLCQLIDDAFSTDYLSADEAERFLYYIDYRKMDEVSLTPSYKTFCLDVLLDVVAIRFEADGLELDEIKRLLAWIFSEVDDDSRFDSYYFNALFQQAAMRQECVLPDLFREFERLYFGFKYACSYSVQLETCHAVPDLCVALLEYNPLAGNGDHFIKNILHQHALFRAIMGADPMSCDVSHTGERITLKRVAISLIINDAVEKNTFVEMGLQFIALCAYDCDQGENGHDGFVVDRDVVDWVVLALRINGVSDQQLVQTLLSDPLCDEEKVMWFIANYKLHWHFLQYDQRQAISDEYKKILVPACLDHLLCVEFDADRCALFECYFNKLDDFDEMTLVQAYSPASDLSGVDKAYAVTQRRCINALQKRQTSLARAYFISLLYIYPNSAVLLAKNAFLKGQFLENDSPELQLIFLERLTASARGLEILGQGFRVELAHVVRYVFLTRSTMTFDLHVLPLLGRWSKFDVLFHVIARVVKSFSQAHIRRFFSLDEMSLVGRRNSLQFILKSYFYCGEAFFARQLSSVLLSFLARQEEDGEYYPVDVFMQDFTKNLDVPDEQKQLIFSNEILRGFLRPFLVPNTDRPANPDGSYDSIAQPQRRQWLENVIQYQKDVLLSLFEGEMGITFAKACWQCYSIDLWPRMLKVSSELCLAICHSDAQDFVRMRQAFVEPELDLRVVLALFCTDAPMAVSIFSEMDEGRKTELIYCLMRCDTVQQRFAAATMMHRWKISGFEGLNYMQSYLKLLSHCLSHPVYRRVFFIRWREAMADSRVEIKAMAQAMRLYVMTRIASVGVLYGAPLLNSTVFNLVSAWRAKKEAPVGEQESKGDDACVYPLRRKTSSFMARI